MEAAQHAVQALGGRPLPSGPYAVVVAPRVGTQFLSLVAGALSAEAIQTGRSFIKDPLNTMVANERVTLVDDPLLPGGIASTNFDDEGSPCQTLTLVAKGRFQSILYDLRSAALDKKDSNGHGFKTDLSSVPRPHATNFHMKPGAFTLEELLNSQERIFYLQDVLGLHMVDPITGEFSLGASGALYLKGCFVQPVRGITIAGQLNEILHKIVAVGRDVVWVGSVGSPTFLISNLTISGS
jgi:PmbA protein